MSQTWVIKDTAPVDEASLTLETTNISFTTNNEKATSIGIVQDGSIVMLIYGGISGGAQLVLGASPSFEWDNEAYRTLEFDTAPTGELLAWLQKNANKQYDHMMKYQDIHTTDSALWKQYQDHMAKGEYDAAKAILAQTQLDNKRIDASLFNDITTELTRLQNQGKDSTWSKNTMAVQEEPPANMQAGECYCKITKKLS